MRKNKLEVVSRSRFFSADSCPDYDTIQETDTSPEIMMVVFQVVASKEHFEMSKVGSLIWVESPVKLTMEKMYTYVSHQ